MPEVMEKRGPGPTERDVVSETHRARLLARRKILLMIDEPMNRALVEAILQEEHDFESLMSDNQVELSRAVEGTDLIVVDLQMPPSELFLLCKQIKSTPRASGVPVLLLTPTSGVSAVERSRALLAGADEVLGKPFHRSELIMRVRSLLRVKSLRDELDEAEQILLSFCRAVEAKASYTQAHNERVALYAEMLGQEVGLTRDDLRILRRAALLHDVGKIAIPDLILNKPGALTGEETQLLRQQLLLPTQAPTALTNSTPQIIPIIRHHHEHYDGTGYPDHLAGEEIPLGARILAIADAFDAMTSQRPYRAAFSADRAAMQLRLGAGTQWDKYLVDTFLRTLNSVKEISAPVSNGH
jgi:putative two-component system response regulator